MGLSKIIIGADFVPTSSNVDLFIEGNINALFGSKLLEHLSNASIRIFNLEVPFTDNEAPIRKWGPNLIAPTTAIKAYKMINTNILTLANNHILDQGEQGLNSTCKILSQNGIAYLGAGITLEEASKPYIIDCDGKKIGLYACAEHEFSIASNNSAGANPFDPLESLDHILKLKKQCDFLIVFFHGGKEHYRYPSPNLQKICRKIVEKGANLVICQHSHCVGCEEKFLTGRIVYGQGNFLFDDSESDYWKTSILIQIQNDFSITYLPLVKCGNKVRLAEEKLAQNILDKFYQRSEEIKNKGFIEENYNIFANSTVTTYLTYFLGKRSFLFYIINKLLCNYLTKWSIQRKYNSKILLAIQNCIECEAHRELLLQGVKQYGK